MAMFSSVRALSFDVGGTLLVPHPSVGGVYADVLRALGYPADPDEMECRFRKAFTEIPRSAGEPVSEETERAFWRAVTRHTFGPLIPDEARRETAFSAVWDAFARGRRWAVVEGAEETLKELRQRRFRLVVLSNADRRFHQVLGETGLDRFFEHIVLSADIGFEKPDIRAFHSVEDSLWLRGVQILHVGDSRANDIEGALQAGWHAAWFRSDEDRHAADSKAPVITSLREILTLVEDSASH